jgi:hypothetical protein
MTREVKNEKLYPPRCGNYKIPFEVGNRPPHRGCQGKL